MSTAPTAEDAVAAQRAGQGPPPPPPPGSGPAPAIVAAAALAATTVAAAQAAGAPRRIAQQAAAEVAQVAAAGILTAFDALLTRRRRALTERVVTITGTGNIGPTVETLRDPDAPDPGAPAAATRPTVVGLTADELRDLEDADLAPNPGDVPERPDSALDRPPVPAPAPDPAIERQVSRAREEDLERLYAAKARQRFQVSVSRALAQPDLASRRDALARAVDRERHFARARDIAVESRLTADERRWAVRAASPEGAFWTHNPLLDNCMQCRAMSGKAWPWSVLDHYHPMLHHGCACKLWTLQYARRMGWLKDGQSIETNGVDPRTDFREAAVCGHEHPDTEGDLDASA